MKNPITERNLYAIVTALFFTAVFALGEEPPLVIKAGKILTVSGGIIENGSVLIQDGKIKSIGTDIDSPEGAQLIDAGDAWLMPGFIEAHTSMGSGSLYGGLNSDETSDPNTAQLSILDAVNPFDKNFLYVREAGITTLMLSQGRLNVIGGQTAVVKPRGKTVTQMAVKSPAGVKISLGEGPKSTYGEKGRLPSTRMGSAYVLRKALQDARHYLDKWENYRDEDKKDEAQKPKLDLQLDPLAKLLKQEIPAFIECYRVDDIMTALRIIDEFNLKAVLVGCTEGYKIPGEISCRDIPVIVSPFGVGPRRMETKDLKHSNAAVLHGAGVKVVIKADESLGIGSIRELPLLAAMAVKGGLNRETALRAITLHAAEVLGVADKTGSLDQGKDADIVLLDGDPLDYRTRVINVFIDGKSVYKK
jgi:imidazolonepropionase-like amidohydrolase